jgi:hypothetical protein
MRCYCSICRKTGGGGGYLINILAKAATLSVEGKGFVKVYRSTITEEDGSTRPSTHERHFCGECGAHLWAFNQRWPTLLHPVATALDSELPEPVAFRNMFLRSKPAWVDADEGKAEANFETYPDESLEAWHRRHGVYQGE